MLCVLQVTTVGWNDHWNGPLGIPKADITWLKKPDIGLYGPIQIYQDKNKVIKRRRVMKDDRMWFYPPDYPGFLNEKKGISPETFFCSRVFVWRPVGVWKYSLKCPRGNECVGYREKKNVTLGLSGYYHRV